MHLPMDRERGYSLAELLTVVAIVGIMSLVLVPQFVSYQQTAKLKGGLRTFSSDIRNCRQVAISRYVQVRIELTSSRRYTFTYRTSPSGTWNAFPVSVLTSPGMPIATAGGPSYRDLPEPVTILSNTFGDLDANSKSDILFNIDGTITNPDPSIIGGTVTLKTPWTKLPADRMIINVTGSGGITTTASHS